MNDQILSYCRITNHSVTVNGEPFFSSQSNEELPAFLSALYKKIELNYPKFFKMDKLCKAGVLAIELLIRNTKGFDKMDKSRMALIFSNRASSIDSDRAHIKTISDRQNYFPSPSVFVYTLPNIITGEIAIKHKITGENAFFISQQFDPEMTHRYASLLMHSGSTDAALCGWINSEENMTDVFVYCVKKGNFKMENKGPEKPHSAEILRQLFKR